VVGPPTLGPGDPRALPAMTPAVRPPSDGYVPPALTAVTPVTSLASRRILRRVNLWSVLKISMILYLSLFLVGAVASLVVWKAADSAGLIGKVENLMQELGFKNFEFVGEKLFFDYVLFSLLLAGLAIVGTLVAALLYNLIAEIVGGVEVTVVEQVAFLEEVEVEEFVYDDPDFVDDPDDPLERRRRFF
jgi:hypothetical protein